MTKTYLLLGSLLVLTAGLVIIYLLYINPSTSTRLSSQQLFTETNQIINKRTDINWEFRTDLPVSFNENQFRTLATNSGLLHNNNILDYDTRSTYKPSLIIVEVLSVQNLANVKTIETYQGEAGAFFGYTLTRTSNQTKITFYFTKEYLANKNIETVVQDANGLFVKAFYLLGEISSQQRSLTIEEKQQLNIQASKAINQYELIFQ